jgi:hypothetical protein
LDLDSTLDTPPARGQSRQDIDTADSTLDFYKDLDLDPWPEPALPSPLNFTTWDSYSEPPNTSSPSSRGIPEQSNTSALEASDTEIQSPSGSFDGGWNLSGLAMEPAYPDRVSTLSDPVEKFTVTDVESQQFYTRDTRNASDPAYNIHDTSNLDIFADSAASMKRSDPTIETPTAKNVESQQRNTSAFEDALDPATMYPWTYYEALDNDPVEQEELAKVRLNF